MVVYHTGFYVGSGRGCILSSVSNWVYVGSGRGCILSSVSY